MAPRTTARSLASSSSTPMPVREPPPVAQAVANSPPQLLELRRQWKWAAVCQFFYTFATLIALDDVTVTDIEEDLLNSSMIVLPRLMQRLLVTLTQDRKTNLDNWQTTLRRQYNKRDPQANPIGPDPLTIVQKSRATTVDSETAMDEMDGNAEVAAVVVGAMNGVDHVTEDDDAPQENVASEGAKVETMDVKTLVKDDAAKVEEYDAAVGNGVDGGKEEEPLPESKDWAELSMLEKLDSVHTVMEWHFQNPLRLRGIMRSDDEYASWRTAPIGYDAKHNAYWLIGIDRLWLQRPVPSPPKKKKPKKKPVPAKKPKVKLRLPSTKSTTVPQPQKGVSRPLRNQKSSRTTQRKVTEENAVSSSPQGSGRARAAKTQANVMLDLQAKQLLAVKAEMRSLSRNKGHKDIQSPLNSPSKHAAGTRVSRRLRGSEVEDDEWQQIPEDWLAEPGSSRQVADEAKRKTRQSPRKRQREDDSDEEFVAPKVIVTGTGLESGDESELTELSDTGSVVDDAEAFDVKEEEEKAVDEKSDDDEEKLPEVWPPPDFVEWETICVSLDEWEAIPKTFEGSKHYLEKALYKMLTKDIVPFVTEGLREAAKLRAKEEAMMQRKRSSRLAVRETEKEAARLAAQQKAEEDEKMARTRRQEARTRREEEERLAREKAREQRRIEREERELQRAKRQEWSVDQSEEMQVDVEEPAADPEQPKLPPANGHANPPSKAPRKRSAAKKDAKGKSSAEDWELDCEICGEKGRNRDDGLPLMCCGSCSKWQHISCHDTDDDRNHRPRRDWDKVDFTCRNCLSRKKSRTSNGKKSSISTSAVTLHRVPQPQGSAAAQAPFLPPVNSYPPSKHNGYPADAAKLPPPNVYQHYPAANNAHHPSLGHIQMPYNSNAAMTFAHYQPHQRGFAPQPTTLQPQPQLNHQPYYGQLQASHPYQHPPVSNNFHPSLQNGAAYSNFPGPLQVPPSVQTSERSTQSSGAPLPAQYRNHYPPIASGSTPYYRAPLQ